MYYIFTSDFAKDFSISTFISCTYLGFSKSLDTLISSSSVLRSFSDSFVIYNSSNFIVTKFCISEGSLIFSPCNDFTFDFYTLCRSFCSRLRLHSPSRKILNDGILHSFDLSRIYQFFDNINGFSLVVDFSYDKDTDTITPLFSL